MTKEDIEYIKEALNAYGRERLLQVIGVISYFIIFGLIMAHPVFVLLVIPWLIYITIVGVLLIRDYFRMWKCNKH